MIDAVADASNEWIFPDLAEPRWSGVQYIAVSEMADPPHEVDVSDTVELAVASLSEHKRYLELLSDDPVDMQARQVVDMSTLNEDGGAGSASGSSGADLLSPRRVGARRGRHNLPPGQPHERARLGAPARSAAMAHGT